MAKNNQKEQVQDGNAGGEAGQKQTGADEAPAAEPGTPAGKPAGTGAQGILQELLLTEYGMALPRTKNKER